MDLNTVAGIKDIAKQSYNLIMSDTDYFEWSIAQGKLIKSIFDDMEASVDRNAIAVGLVIVGGSLGGAVSGYAGREYELSNEQYATALFANEMGAAMTVAAHQLFTESE